MKDDMPNCAACPIDDERRVCRTEDGIGPGSCPTLAMDDAIQSSRARYSDPEVAGFYGESVKQEMDAYADRSPDAPAPRAIKTRIEETCEFARRMGYKRLGLAFCSGLRREAEILERILRSQGFEVVSVICKVGRLESEDGSKPACNPVGQAEVLNRANTEFNIMLGLCVGHDAIFLKHANAYTTVLAAKDRVLGHNPLAALYTASSYYRRLVCSD